MKTIAILFSIFLFVSCSNSVDYSAEHIKQTSGRYLFNPDEVIEIYYENEKLFLKWRGAENIRPVIFDQHTFFVADMYKKLRFTQHPDTNERYLSIVNSEDEEAITYDYLKLADSINIPSIDLKNGNFDKALEGYLKIKNQDSTSLLVDEGEFNRLGYNYLGRKEYKNAIDIFIINVALYPESSNVYDSLADAYLRSGDSLQAFTNYQKALELNKDNKRAKQYVNDYKKK